MTPKIATCCYCGTRAALTLRGTERHELACSNCGAPLHEMKMLRSNSDAEREVRGLAPSRPYTKSDAPKYDQRRRKKKKKTKSLSRRFMEEVFDAAEDIFDIFD
ncbi:MAG: hypothetical protein ACU0GG_03160 [Paracoccaceae bacterium]